MTINVNDRTYQGKTVQICSIMIPSNVDNQQPIVTMNDVFTVILMEEKQGFQR